MCDNDISNVLKVHIVKRGFGPGRVKEYFVAQVDGDTLGGIVAGPFDTKDQAIQALDALRPLYNRPLTYVGGHLA